MQNKYLSYIQWHYRHFHMLYQHLAIYFLKAEYIIQVMNSAVKDKWGVGSSLDLSPIKAPIQAGMLCKYRYFYHTYLSI
jgi:hypothetical protein